MRQIAFIIIILLTCVPTLAQAESLRQQAIIQDDVIRLGDLFNGLDRNEDHVLGTAPQPGKDIVLSARTLQRVAVAMGLSWRPVSTRDSITVKRAATIIEEDIVKSHIRDALLAEGISGNYDLILTSGSSTIILPPSMRGTADVTKLQHDPETGWFSATLAAPSRDEPEVEAHFSGKIERLSEVPVLRDTVRNGMVIGERDIDIITIPSRLLNHDVILRAEDLKGLTPRRMIAAGKPIKEQDVESPRIVERGENVTVIYQNGPLRLTATGKALEYGAKGDIIRVVNNQTSQSIDATVSGKREVTVATF